jgi:hypothetical protein
MRTAADQQLSPDDVAIANMVYSHLSKTRVALWGYLVFTSGNKCNVVFTINDQPQGPSTLEHLPRRKDRF